MADRRRGERGASHSTQMALIWPAVLAVVLLALQWGLHSWARACALAAAQDAAWAVAALGGDESDGLAAADDALAGGVLVDPEVVVRLSRGVASAVVTGRAPGVLGRAMPQIVETSSQPMEQMR